MIPNSEIENRTSELARPPRGFISNSQILTGFLGCTFFRKKVPKKQVRHRKSSRKIVTPFAAHPNSVRPPEKSTVGRTSNRWMCGRSLSLDFPEDFQGRTGKAFLRKGFEGVSARENRKSEIGNRNFSPHVCEIILSWLTISSATSSAFWALSPSTIGRVSETTALTKSCSSWRRGL